MAAAAGMTLDEALAVNAAPAAKDFFADLDERMEAKEPGWKADRNAERLAKIRAWHVRREALVAKYGSIAAAIYPCERERLILAAISPWRTVQSNSRWTDTLDGWRGDSFSAREKAPPHVVRAIEEAYPLPTTFAQAKAEHEYWTDRNRELEDATCENAAPIGDEELDLPVSIRAEIVRNLAEHELACTTLQDLHARFAMYRDLQCGNQTIEDALFRDIETMSLRERDDLATVHSVHGKPTPAQPTSAHLHGQIRTLLREHGDWSDRRIARDVGCSPTTVGRIRRLVGADRSSRAVHRRGRTYEMKIKVPKSG